MKKLFVLFLLMLLLPNVAEAKCFEAGGNLQQIGELKTVLRCFEQEITSLKKQLKEGGGGSIIINAVPGLPEPQVSMSTVSGKKKLDLLECKRVAGAVKCIFRLTNTGDDVGFRFFNISRAFDELGNEYKPGLVNIGDMSYDLTQGHGSMKHLISGVPVMVDLIFKSVPRKSTQFTAINIIGGYNVLPPFKFRNVAIID